MLVSANDTTVTTTENVTARSTDLIYCITSFEESPFYLFWYSHSLTVVSSNEFKMCRLIGQVVFEETWLHFFIGAFIKEICSVEYKWYLFKGTLVN